MGKNQQQALLRPNHITQLEGTVERVFATNGDWAALKLRLKDNGQSVSIVGNLAQAATGDVIRGDFAVTEHKTFGRQFKALSVEIEADDGNTSGLIEFMIYHVKGIGVSLAHDLVAHYSDGVTEVLEDPEELENVSGIGYSKAKSIHESWVEAKPLYETMRHLYTLGLSPKQASKAVTRFGNSAFHVLSEDIYRLTEARGIGFKTVDVIALKHGMAENDPRRLRAAAAYGATQALSDGHTVFDSPMLIDYIEGKTNLSRSDAIEGINLALEAELIIKVNEKFAALPRAKKVEEQIIKAIKLRTSLTTETGVRLKPLNKDLTDEQKRAFTALETNRLFTLTGNPGVGKTFTVGSLTQAADKQGVNLALCAPTGKAARRLEELAGKKAHTIHRLLGWDPEYGNFIYNKANPLPYDLIIADEFSCADIYITRALLDAVHPNSSIILVGDVDQLPPVGPGQPFASTRGEVVRLTEIFRQARENPIIMACHTINRGEPPYFPDDERFKFINFDEKEALRDALPSFLGALSEAADGELPQIITPMNIGPLGVHSLNAMVKSIINPGRGEGYKLGLGYIAHEGDLVLQTKNDYDIGMMNGEIARVLRYDKRYLVLETLLGDELILERKHARTLQLAYAITVHRYQGSQSNNVLFICHMSHYIMLTRELIYTAVSRAVQRCWIMGNHKALNIGVKRQGNQRKTLMDIDEAWEMNVDE